jgi:hypothetical protein
VSPDDLAEVGLRHLLLGEPLRERLGLLEHMANPGVDRQALEQAFERSDEEAGPVARLVLADALIGSGNAAAITRLEVGPRQDDGRDIVLEWLEPRVYSNLEPQIRRLEGTWRRPSGDLRF